MTRPRTGETIPGDHYRITQADIDAARHPVPDPTAPLTITEQHLADYCRPGQGADCCRYLTMSAKGWECAKHGEFAALLDARVAAQNINARGDNCPGVPAP